VKSRFAKIALYSVLGLALVAGIAVAEEQGGSTHRGMRGMHGHMMGDPGLAMMLHRLNLTSDQWAQVKKIFEAEKPNMQPLHQQEFQAHQQMMQLITSGNFDALIDFLATQNQATVLAEPNLVAMSGETANFLAGGEIPVIAPQAGTLSGAFSVTYKPYGISLSFTPTIVGDRINLKVAPEVSQVSTVGALSVPLTPTSTVTVPAVQTRRASTTVELGSGQSFAIAGLLMRQSQDDIRKMPWLGDVPVLGTLFKSDAYQRQETELVIIITPYFVEPTSGRLQTPMSGRVPPTDTDRLVMQRFVRKAYFYRSA